MFKIVSNLSQSIFLLLFFLNTNVYSQTLGELLEKILKKDESINSSKIAIDKANNDLSSVFSAFTPKIDLSMPIGNEKLINNDAVNTDLDYYEFSAKITQNIYDFGNSTSKYKNAKNKIEIAQISKNNVISNKIFEAITAYLGYIKAYEAESGIRVDAVLLDYLDLMMPVSVKVSAENLFIKDKYVSEELRNFAMESQYLFATASQLNRGAVDEIEFDHSHISGGLSKVQTADNVIGIFSSRAMRERGRVQIQFMKTRSSSAVGTKLDLAFDIDSLRIEDLDEQETEEQSAQTIYDKLKNKSNTVDVVNTTVEKAVDSQDRLRSLLKKMD